MVRERFTLSEPQLAALDVLADGGTVSEAARAAGVARQTASGWRHHHPTFIAALNGRMRDELARTHTGLLKLAPRALEVLAGDLEKGGHEASQAARDVLGWAVKVGKVASESTDPVIINARVSRERELASLEALVGMDESELFTEGDTSGLDGLSGMDGADELD